MPSVTRPIRPRRPRLRPTTAILLPGSGSDATFVRAAFAAPLRSVGVTLVAPDPQPGPAVVDGLLADLAAAAAVAAARGDIVLVGGISLGAHLAARWATRGRPGGLLLALPAWTGNPDAAPAALAARHTAARVRAIGTAATLTEIRADAPAWLADELARAWTGYGTALADSLDAAASSRSPTAAELAALDVPAGVAAVTGDAVHPEVEARRWGAALPRAALVTTTMDAFGADPAALGRAAVLAWLRAGSPEGWRARGGLD